MGDASADCSKVTVPVILESPRICATGRALARLRASASQKETEAKREQRRWTPNEDDIDLTVDADTNQEDDVDVTLVADTNQEDYIDYGIDDLNETEEAVVPEAKPVEVLMKKRKASEDEEASVVEKKPKRVRNRK